MKARSRKRRAAGSLLRRRVAVVIAARAAERWIEEAINSIRRQRTSQHFTHSLRIGVDACEPTSARLLELGVDHWYSPRHVGPYVLRNSLIYTYPEECELALIFDSDDVMHGTDYIETLARLAWPRGISGAARLEVDAEGNLRARRSAKPRPGGRPHPAGVVPYQHGAACFSASALKRIGGFRPWMMAADSDAIARAIALGIPVRATKRALYLRRTHGGNLTQLFPPSKPGPTPGERLPAHPTRAALWAQGQAALERGELYVEPVTTPLERREANP